MEPDNSIAIAFDDVKINKSIFYSVNSSKKLYAFDSNIYYKQYIKG